MCVYLFYFYENKNLIKQIEQKKIEQIEKNRMGIS